MRHFQSASSLFLYFHPGPLSGAYFRHVKAPSMQQCQAGNRARPTLPAPCTAAVRQQVRTSRRVECSCTNGWLSHNYNTDTKGNTKLRNRSLSSSAQAVSIMHLQVQYMRCCKQEQQTRGLTRHLRDSPLKRPRIAPPCACCTVRRA